MQSFRLSAFAIIGGGRPEQGFDIPAPGFSPAMTGFHAKYMSTVCSALVNPAEEGITPLTWRGNGFAAHVRPIFFCRMVRIGPWLVINQTSKVYIRERSLV